MKSLPAAFGPRLRALRTDRGLSLSEFARRLYYSKGHVSRIENGIQSPSAEFVRRCDAELGANGELVAMMSAAASVAEPDAPARSALTDTDEEIWMMTMTPDGATGFSRIPRREVLKGSAVILAGIGLPATPRPPATNAAAQLLHHRKLLTAARDLGQLAPPGTVLPMLVGQAQALRTLAKDVRGAMAAEVATLSARTAEFAGWMAQESGDLDASAWWTDKAVEVATAAGDHHTASYALVRRALVTMYQGDAAATIGLARQAQGTPGTSLRILGLAARREAQGHALAGDYDACLRALERAESHLSSAEGNPGEPVVGTSHVPDPVGIVTGWCLYDLGRPAAAAEVLDREVARIPATAVRARTRFGARQALAHAATGELERACELAGQIIGPAMTVGSATILTDLRRLAAMLRRWSSHASVRALEPALTAALCHGA